MELFVLTAIILGLSFAGLGIRIWIKGRFTESEIGHNKHMREKGIVCAKDEEIRMLRGETEVPSDCGSCSLCCDASHKCS